MECTGVPPFFAIANIRFLFINAELTLSSTSRHEGHRDSVMKPYYPSFKQRRLREKDPRSDCQLCCDRSGNIYKISSKNSGIEVEESGKRQ